MSGSAEEPRPEADAYGPPRYVDRLATAARERLAPELLRYVLQGARDGTATAEAAPAWDRFRLVPRVLVDVTDVDPGTTILGRPYRTPFAVAPTTLQRAAHAEGEVAMARAARDVGSLLVVSSNAGTRFAEIGETGVDWWLQVYLTEDRSLSEPVVRAALDAGARALVLTADTPLVGTKYDGGRPVWESVDPALVRANFEVPDHHLGMGKARDLGPHDVEWLSRRFGVPVVVKGVLNPLDARRCVGAGAAAVWVSNHGGRQLDHVLSTAEALPAVVAAVGGGAVEVYVDGGIRRAEHALAARALGADAVFLGRPPLLALATDGEEGVRRVLTELTEELCEALALCGTAAYRRVDAGLLG